MYFYGYLTCNGNRIISDQMTCAQPPDSVISLQSPWCSTVMKIKFQDDPYLISPQIQISFQLNLISTIALNSQARLLYQNLEQIQNVIQIQTINNNKF
ncbi:unnamed protein product [Paramecium octaurelia]|uniref:Uncharacterized protein n=1 Tax=Paramecium octaurelia TaxID=43137 RepID=A0A8S1WCM3_PAROT|nr:unnamed protein product [Paramecium octaurelia]